MDFRAKTIIIEGRGDTESGGASAGVKQPHGRFHRCRQPRTRRCRTPTLIDDLAVVDAAATEPKMTQASMNALIRRLRDGERHGRIITFAKRKCLGGDIGRRARLRIAKIGVSLHNLTLQSIRAQHFIIKGLSPIVREVQDVRQIGPN